MLHNMHSSQPVVAYESWDQYQALKEEACEKHIDMIDPFLLCYEMRWAEQEIAEMAHDLSWHDRSRRAFEVMTLAPHAIEWCNHMVDMLHFTLKQCLCTALVFVRDDIKKTPSKRMWECKRVRGAVVETIKDFFNEGEGYPCNPLLEAYEDAKFHPARDSRGEHKKRRLF